MDKFKRRSLFRQLKWVSFIYSGGSCVLVDMHMGRLVRLVAIKIEPKSIHSQNCRHMFQMNESASEMVAQRGRVMGRSLKNAVYLGN